MRIYADLAPWFHLLTHPSDYEEEAGFVARVIDATADGPAETLLELGSGGGNNASHLKRRFRCTLTDLSEDMLELSRSLNPECEHVQGDMRTLRLGSTFDAVLVHDAVMYMTTEDDLRAAIATAAAHLRPGGAAVVIPDTTRERFVPATSHGGHDGEDGRSLRYLEWVTDPDPDDSTYDVDFVVVLREPGKALRVEHDRHTDGLFPESTWHRLIEEAGLELVDPGVQDPHAGEHAVFVARAPA
ncbi:MAG: class I SAM-dependent methyltransferase [Gaiellaceae bacterium]